MVPYNRPFHRIDHIPFDPSSYSCPKEITASFKNLTKSCRYTWEGHTIQFFYAHGNCDQKMRYIASLLKVLQPTKPLRADILLSPIKKKYPTNKVFGPSHVNTGYASDEKVVVYREEEWLKVFIHECFHYFHYEEGLMDPAFKTRIRKLFPVQSEFNLYESFCELWARTLNCYLISAYTSIPVDILLRKEKKYSMRHMVNVLAHMGLTYRGIQRPCGAGKFAEATGATSCGFKEETNVLAYVVLTNILINNGYLELHPSIQVDGETLIRFIETHYRKETFVRAIEHTKPHITTTMSINNMEDYSLDRPL